MKRSKTCRECNRAKPLDKFHRDSVSRDGRVTICKKCFKPYRSAQYHKFRAARLEYQREYEIEHIEQRQAYARYYRAKHLEEIKAKANIRNRKWKADNPKKARAGLIFAKALRRGEIERVTECTVCGRSDVLIRAYHQGYDDPLDVRWFCAKCHRRSLNA